jgi:hypothetical protein
MAWLYFLNEKDYIHISSGISIRNKKYSIRFAKKGVYLGKRAFANGVE